jgi:hypothetical protein
MFVCSSWIACETHPHIWKGRTEFRAISNREHNEYWHRWVPGPELDDNNDPFKMLTYKVLIAMKTLEAYSLRKMSFDRDAFHAIAGILKIFAKDGVHSIWGTPCFYSVRKYAIRLCNGRYSWLDLDCPERVVEIALLMDNAYPCERRLGFPSWSPLGWSSPIEWTGGEGPDRRRTYPRYVTAEASSIKIESRGKSYNLSSLLTRTNFEIEDTMMKASPYLEITARTITLRLVDPKHEKYSTAVAFPLHDGNHKIFYPRWTNTPTELEQGSRIKGLLLLGAEFTTRIAEHIYAMVFILGEIGGHYERIGDFVLPKELPSPGSWRQWDEERHVWFFDGGRAVPIQEETEESDNDQTQEEYTPEYWWWRYFKDEETIILG